MQYFILVPFWMLFYNTQLAFSPSKKHLHLILSIPLYFSLSCSSLARRMPGKNLLWVGFQGTHPIKFNGN